MTPGRLPRPRCPGTPTSSCPPPAGRRRSTATGRRRRRALPASNGRPPAQIEAAAPEPAADRDQPVDVWDQRVADGPGLPAPAARRDYEVDEFGFDPELTDAVFQPLLRLLYRDWFRTEVFGIEQRAGRRRRRWSSATTPARSRSTR